jgi:hypothetical protein
MQVLRTTFFLLVLGSLLLFVWGQGYLGAPGGSGEPERLAAQLQPEKLKIVSKGEPPPKAAEPPREECRALEGLDHESAAKLAALLTGRDAQLKVAQRTQEEPQSWWVHIPPLPNSAQADKKAAELGKLGIKDFYVVREKGANQYALSLGLFRSEESAKEYLAALAKKNVKSARIQQREAAGDRSFVEVRGTAEQVAKALTELPPEFAGAHPAACVAAKP